ncbi:MAG: cell wall hydrolase [Lachnospiraceae bacterium]|nr:cell wall hydrolase [Lachnospiraceae bacterium]
MKRKLLKTLICLTICGSMIVGLFSEGLLEVSAVSEETQEQIDQAEDEKEQLENELEQQEQNKDNLEGQKATAEEKLKNLKAQYQSIASDLEALEEKQAEKEAEIETKTRELEEAIATQEEQYENMKLRIQYMYEQPEDSLFTLLLQDFSIVEILNRVDNTVKIQEYDRQQLEEYTKAAEEIELQKEELETAKAELEALIAEAEEQQKKVAAMQKETSTSINNYLNQIAEAEEKIGNTEAALEAKSKALKELYAKAQAEEAAERRRQAEEAAKRLQEALANGTIKPEDSGIVYGELNLTQAELDMLTAMIYCEARGESYEGQLAVGYVIMNRVRSSKFPNNLESVLRQSKQFEPAGSGRFDIVLTAYWGGIPGVIGESEWNSCQKAALVCVNSDSNVGESLFFRTHAPVPQLAENLEAAGVPYWIIGNHIFYYSWVNY